MKNMDSWSNLMAGSDKPAEETGAASASPGAKNLWSQYQSKDEANKRLMREREEIEEQQRIDEQKQREEERLQEEAQVLERDATAKRELEEAEEAKERAEQERQLERQKAREAMEADDDEALDTGRDNVEAALGGDDFDINGFGYGSMA